MSVDILPSSLPLDASRHFCGVLMPYLRALIDECRGRPGSREHLEALNVATVAQNGELQGKHRGLAAPVERWQASRAAEIASKAGIAETLLRKKRVLMLGSGMVAGPAVQEICKRSDVDIIVGQLLYTYHGRWIDVYLNFRKFVSHDLTNVANSRQRALRNGGFDAQILERESGVFGRSRCCRDGKVDSKCRCCY